ncbi:hypothetical protein Tco_0368210 [Tanacetum coccineum]
MESVSAQVVATAKLPVLNPGKFEFWKMRIEQHFLMTDYAIWEVILNGESPLPTRTIDGVETSVPPTTTKQKLAKKNYTNEAVKTAHGVSATNSKNNASTLPNVDSMSDAVIYSFFARDRLEVADGNADNESKEISQEDMKESRAPKNQDCRKRETTRRIVPVEETTSNALVSYSSSSDTDVSTCSKACLKSYETLKEHYDNLTKDFNKSQLNVGAYKVELRKKFEKAKKERDDLKLTLEKFENSSKNLSKLLDSQICDKFKSGMRVSCCSPPYTGNFMPPKPDLVLADKDKYVFSESTTSVPSAATSEVKTSVSKPKSVSEPLIED